MPQDFNYAAELIAREDLTPSLAIFRFGLSEHWPGWIDAVPGAMPAWQAGQFTQLGLNNPGKGAVARPYSIASAPEETGAMDFYIRLVGKPASDNPLTPLLWRLKVGDPVYLARAIRGKFTLEETVGHDDKRLKIFVAAGTGSAPFLSMMRSRKLRGLGVEDMAILHGASYAADLGYREMMLDYFKDAPARYIPTISRPAPGDGWDGWTGRVESHFAAGRIEALEERLGFGRGGLNPDNCVVFICGLHETIRNTLLALMRRGFVPDEHKLRRALNIEELPASLFYENYDTTPVINTHDPEDVRAAVEGTPFESRQTD